MSNMEVFTNNSKTEKQENSCSLLTTKNGPQLQILDFHYYGRYFFVHILANFWMYSELAPNANPPKYKNTSFQAISVSRAP